MSRASLGRFTAWTRQGPPWGGAKPKHPLLKLPVASGQTQSDVAGSCDLVTQAGERSLLFRGPLHTGEGEGSSFPADAPQIRQIRVPELDAEG